MFPSPIPVTHGRNRCYIHIYSKVWPFQQRTFAARQEARKGENKKQKQKGTVSESITLINWTDCRLTAQNYANSTENKIKFLTYGKLESGEWSVEWSGVLLVWHWLANVTVQGPSHLMVNFLDANHTSGTNHTNPARAVVEDDQQISWLLNIFLMNFSFALAEFLSRSLVPVPVPSSFELNCKYVPKMAATGRCDDHSAATISHVHLYVNSECILEARRGEPRQPAKGRQQCSIKNAKTFSEMQAKCCS